MYKRFLASQLEVVTLYWQVVMSLFPIALLKVGITPVQSLPVRHTRPELVCQPLLPDRLELSIVVAVSQMLSWQNMSLLRTQLL